MERSTSAAADRKKTATAAALFAVVSFFLPFFEFRANRVSVAASFSLFTSGIEPIAMAALFVAPLFLIAAAFERRPAVAAVGLYAAAPAAIVFTAIAAATFGRAGISDFGPFSRWGIGVGGWLYLASSFIPFLGDRRPFGAKAAILGSLGTLAALAAVIGAAAATGAASRWGLAAETAAQADRLLRETGNHLRLTAIAVACAAAIGLPAAVWAFARPNARALFFPLLSLLQTIPSIALFGLLIAPLAALARAVPALGRMGIRGIGDAPALIALALYALYPVIRYSYAALESIDAGVLDAAAGIGMKKSQLWSLVRIPLAAPFILHGIRVALVQSIGNATLAKLIGGSGLGVFVFEGLGQASADMVLIGMTAIILLTIGADRLFGSLIVILTPIALRDRTGAAS